MKKPKKREFQASDLVKSFARIYSFEDKLVAFEIRHFLQSYLDASLYAEIQSVNLVEDIIKIKIASPLLRNDFQLRKTFYLKKFRDAFPNYSFSDLYIY